MNTATGPQTSATEWLSQALLAGAVESAHVKALAEQAGIGTKALRNARGRLGVVATRQGNGRGMRSVWSIPIGGRQAQRELGEGVAAGLQSTAVGIRSPSGSTLEMLTSVKVGDLTNPVVRGDHTSLSKALLALDSGPSRVAPTTREMLRIAKSSVTPPEHEARAEMTQFERTRASLRVQIFVQRGMNESAARDLAIRLLLERDRTNGRALGSCVECQAFVRDECAMMRPITVIHECWRRRHDGP